MSVSIKASPAPYFLLPILCQENRCHHFAALRMLVVNGIPPCGTLDALRELLPYFPESLPCVHAILITDDSLKNGRDVARMALHRVNQWSQNRLGHVGWGLQDKLLQ